MRNLSTEDRVENGPMGAVAIPLGAYYGSETARAILNFQISDVRINQFPALVQGLAYVKLATARANARLGILDRNKAEAIDKACREILSGQHLNEFPIDVYQGGAGTSTNMNVNEVIANRGLEILGLPRGQYDRLHPNNDVNLSQSTNDVYPTAIRLAILLTAPQLTKAMVELAAAFEDKSKQFADVLKLGRTQLQDAVPMTLGQEFMAFSVSIRESMLSLNDVVSSCCKINLGGTAIGTGINATRDYQVVVIEELRKVTGITFVAADNLVEACWDTDAFVAVSGALKRLAVKLSKICNDLRLLSSGPRGGLGEIDLPPVQAGSSIMPGKINPVIPEVVNQVAFQVMGNDLAVTLAAESGQLQLNAMEPVIVFNILQSMRLLTTGISTLSSKCVSGISANPQTCKKHLEASMAGATALVPMVGYGRAAVLAKEALVSGRTLQEVLAQQPDLSDETIKRALDLRALTHAVRFQ